MKKKVLFTATVDSHIKNFHLPYLKYFKDNGYEVHVSTNGKDKIPHCDKKHTVSFERSPFRLNNIKAIKQLKSIIDKEGYEIIHTHTPMGSVITRLAALKARKKHKTRVIYTAHGFHFYKGAPLQNWLLYYPVEKFLARYTDTLITINKEDYKRAKKKFNTRVEYVPGVGVDEEKFNFKMTKKEKSELRKTLGIKDSDYVLIYVAELNKNKNQTMLIDAMTELVKKKSSIHLLLVGIDSYKGRHKKQVAKLGLERNVHFLGFRNDVPRLLKVSDLAVSSSMREGLPVNLLEAGFSGVPVVASNCRGNRDVAGAIKVNKFDSSAFSKKINGFTIKSVKFPNHKKNKIDKYKIEKVLNKVAKIYDGELLYNISTPIRVLHVVTKMDRGGLETMIMNYYRRMDTSKVQFDFVVHRKQEGAYDKEIKALGGNIYRLEPIRLKYLINNINSYKEIFNSNKYKIIHSHIDSLSAIPLYIAKKAGLKTRIAHSHTTEFDKDRKSKIRSAAKFFIRFNATHLFACSKESGKFMFGSLRANFRVIPNSIDIKSFKFEDKNRNKMRKELGIDDKCLVVIHVGRFSAVKNHDFLLEVFSKVLIKKKNSRLILVGDGELRDSVVDKVNELGIGNKVILLGTRQDIPCLLSAADIFVLPSLYEGSPVSIIEAQASGLGVLSTVGVNEVAPAAREKTKQLTLDITSEEWAAEILNLSGAIKGSRLSFNYLLQGSGFDICVKYRELFNFYQTEDIAVLDGEVN